jgi:hypothetical protein
MTLVNEYLNLEFKWTPVPAMVEPPTAYNPCQLTTSSSVPIWCPIMDQFRDSPTGQLPILVIQSPVERIQYGCVPAIDLYAHVTTTLPEVTTYCDDQLHQNTCRVHQTDILAIRLAIRHTNGVGNAFKLTKATSVKTGEDLMAVVPTVVYEHFRCNPMNIAGARTCNVQK